MCVATKPTQQQQKKCQRDNINMNSYYEKQATKMKKASFRNANEKKEEEMQCIS